MIKKTGFIAIIGNPNAGKSTLLNSLIQQKVSIVSPKPQTTRNTVTGIYTEGDYQMIFVDTPGTIKPRNKLGEYMAKSIDKAVIGVDCILLVIDGHDGIDNSELDLVEKYGDKGVPLVVVVSKTDISQPNTLMPELARLNEYPYISQVFAVSARKNKNIDLLREELKKYLPEGEFNYGEDEVTDKSLRYMVCEQIREKILLVLNYEVPHGIGVMLNKMEFDTVRQIWDIDANIIVEKQSHKPILLGKGGEMIKQIATHARISMEKLLEGRVNLQLWIKVKPDWRDSEYLVSEIGYNKKDL
ncbi:MAG: GTPase Era [Clostridia bacterium]